MKRAVEGNAWQADHILPVYKVRCGGRMCRSRGMCVGQLPLLGPLARQLLPSY